MDYTISPLSEHTGAEVRGIDLTEPVDEVTRPGSIVRLSTIRCWCFATSI